MPKKIILSIIKWVSYSVILVIFVAGTTLAISYLNDTYPPEARAAESAARVGQIHLQQESVTNFYNKIFPEEPSAIIPSASDAVQVSVTVLDNMSLHIDQSQPIYATNWFYGVTLYHENIDSQTIIYTIAADY